MIRLADIIQEIITENTLLQFGMMHRLLNLTRLADLIRPMVHARTKKEVTISAILMSLSRIQKKLDTITTWNHRQIYEISNVTIHGGLCIASYIKEEKLQEKIYEFYKHVQTQEGYVTITEGRGEITLIFENNFNEVRKKTILQKPRYFHANVSSLGVNFSEKSFESHGLLYIILEQFFLQNINILEVASTYTEFMIYLDTKDVKLGFETLFTHFFGKKE